MEIPHNKYDTELLNALLLLEADPDYLSYFGLCVRVSHALERVWPRDSDADAFTIAVRGCLSRRFFSLIRSWPEYSGEVLFPVPHPSLPPSIAYETSRKSMSMYDPNTEYGAARLRLLDYLIATLVRELNDEGA